MAFALDLIFWYGIYCAAIGLVLILACVFLTARDRWLDHDARRRIVRLEAHRKADVSRLEGWWLL